MRTRVRFISVCLAGAAVLGAGAAAAHGQSSEFQPFGGGAPVALNSAGESVVAWAGPTGIDVVTGGAAGFTAPVRLAPASLSPSSPQVAIDDAGNALVVWETTRTIRPTCARCEPYGQSTGVWVARRPAGSAFGAPQQLAGVLERFTVGSSKLARPRLAATRDGRAVIGWADLAGSVAATFQGGAFGAPRRLGGADYTVDSIAISGPGEVVASDRRARVVTCQPGALCDAPRSLPAGETYEQPDVLVAAGATGKLIAAYREGQSLRVTQRAPGGDWSPSATLAGPPGASYRGAAIADDGVATVTWLAGGDPRLGQRTRLFEAHWTDLAAISSAAVSPADRDANAGFGALALTPAGDVAFTWQSQDLGAFPPGRAFAQLAVRRHDAAQAGPAVTLTSPDAWPPLGDQPDVAINARGELLATWGEYRDSVVRLQAQWLASDGPHAPVTLATARFADPGVNLARGHHALVTFQSPVKPTARGYVPVALRCISLDRQRCNGTLSLRRGRTRVGRARFTIAPNTNRRIFVRVSRGTRRTLVRRRSLTLVATAVTTAPNGAAGSTSQSVYLRRR